MKNKKIILSIILIFAIPIIAVVIINKTDDSMIQTHEKKVMPIIELRESSNTVSGGGMNYVTVEHKMNASDSPHILHKFGYGSDSNEKTSYEITYLSPQYLVVKECSFMAPCSEHLFDLELGQQIQTQFPSSMGTYIFSPNEQYIFFAGVGRIATPGLSLELIDGKKVNCLISEEEIENLEINDHIITFDENAISEEYVEKIEQKTIDIKEFCKY